MTDKLKTNGIKMVTSGVFIALATVLSMITVYKLPYGGSITLLSMLPIMMLGYMYGIKHGITCGAIYGVLQALLGAVMSSAFAGLSGISAFFMVVLDYLLAFMVLGMAGIFKGKIKNDTLAFSLGGAFAGLLRLIAHFLSGFILWGEYAEWFFGAENMNNEFGNAILSNFSGTSLAMIYSAVYNASYMIPEIIITVVGIVIIMNVKPLKNKIINS